MVREFAFLTRRRHRALAVLASTFLVFASVAVVSTNADSLKPYTIDGIPGTSVQPAGVVTLTLAVPSTSNQQLGSFEINFPPGFTVTGLGSGVVGATEGTQATTNGITALWQNLNIQPNGSGSISFRLSPPCGGSNLNWQGLFVAQQANQWQSGGSKANYLTLTQIHYFDYNTNSESGTWLVSVTSKYTDPIPTSFNNTTCTYSIGNIPTSIVGGSNAVGLSINNVQGGTLQSLTVGLSSGYSFPGGSTSTTFALNGGAGIAAGSPSYALNFSVLGPCQGSSLTWTFTPSPTFTLVNPTYTDGTSASSLTSVLASPACSLKFTAPIFDAEVSTNPAPTGGATDYRMLSGGSLGSGSFSVGLYDLTGGTQVAQSGVAITVDVTAGSTPGTLEPTDPTTGTTNANGVATFSGVAELTAGTRFQLVASGANATNGYSNAFNVWPTIQPCPKKGSTCTGTFTDSTSGVSSNITGPNATGTYFAGGTGTLGLNVSCDFNPFNYADLYNPAITWYVYGNNPGSTTKTVVRVIPKSVVQLEANNGVSFYHVCYAVPKQFSFNTGVSTGFNQDGTPNPNGTYAAPIPMPGDGNFPNYVNTGNPGSVGNNASQFFGSPWVVGLLPACSTVNNQAPCDAGTVGTGGTRTTTFYLKANDPIYR